MSLGVDSLPDCDRAEEGFVWCSEGEVAFFGILHFICFHKRAHREYIEHLVVKLVTMEEASCLQSVCFCLLLGSGVDLKKWNCKYGKGSGCGTVSSVV